MNSLATGLCQDVIDLRNGNISIEKTKAISIVSSKAIKSIAQGVMLANHQEIQKNKIAARNKRTEAINRNIDFKNKKLKMKTMK